MINPDHIMERLKTIFWFKILKFFDVHSDPGSVNLDPGSGMEKIRIRDKHPGSTTLGVPVTVVKKIGVLCEQLFVKA
jgi:hypothetical protein